MKRSGYYKLPGKVLKLKKLLIFYNNGKVIAGNVCGQAHGVRCGPEMIRRVTEREFWA